MSEPGVARRRAAFVRAAEELGRIAPGTIADVGAHVSGFLATLPDTWNKFAVEPISDASAAIAAAQVIPGFMEEAKLPEGRFDCISAFDVFEHFHDADLCMRTIAAGLRPGGLVMLETATQTARAARLLRAGWYYLSFIEHFQAFDERSIRSLLERHGIKVIRCDRVRHASYGASEQARAIAATLIFWTTTLGGRYTAAWSALNRLLRRGSAAMPPSTLSLEAGHLFVVGRRS